MVFSSLVFIFFFLPVALGAYWLTPARLKNLTLLLASLVFYTWGAGGVVLLLVGTTLLDWALALVVDRARTAGNARRARAATLASVVANLGLLFWFKYAGFFAEQADAALGLVGGWELTVPHVLLPIGVSFFTFHRISYVVDVERGRPALRNPLDLLLYIALFPHLVAGPVVRYGDIADQLHRRSVTLESFSNGVMRFLLGLAKKVVIADAVAHIADRAFAIPGGQLTASTAWLGALAYTVQIYFDFSGYSDMAIGLAQLFGFRFPENFNRPYSAVSMTDFWRRWHITLSRWFRDYVYIPLGGSAGSPMRTYVNLAVVWTLTGFWHGASWTFLAWGAYNGALLMAERATGQRPVGDDAVAHRAARRAITLVLIVAGWVLFRSEGLHQALQVLAAMVPLHPGSLGDALDLASKHDLLMLAVGIASFLLPGTLNAWRVVTDAKGPAPAMARFALVALVVPYTALTLAGGSFSPFLYFRF